MTRVKGRVHPGLMMRVKGRVHPGLMMRDILTLLIPPHWQRGLQVGQFVNDDVAASRDILSPRTLWVFSPRGSGSGIVKGVSVSSSPGAAAAALVLLGEVSHV